jgi:dsDNA-binding SOS-regulon protein
MAVIVKYVVVRDGKEDMIFTTKKEADAYDKMLDIAEQLHDFILTSEIDIGVDQLDDLTFFMAQHRDQIGSILKGITPDATKKGRASKAKAEASAAMETEIEAPAVAEDQAPDTPSVSRAAKSRAAA